MKYILFFILLIFTVLLQAGECELSYPIKSYKPFFAKHFTIDYFNGFKVLTADGNKYLLASPNLNCTTNLPIINTPVKRVAMMSTTYLPTLELLGVEKSLIAFQQKKYIASKVFDLKKVKNLSFKFNSEELLNLNADLIMGHDSNLIDKKQLDVFRKLKIPVVINKDFEEITPLGRAEWIIYTAAFFNQDQKAQSLFESIKSGYLKIKKLNENRTTRVNVLVGEIQNGRWVTCGGLSDLAQMIFDAGGKLAFDKALATTQELSLELISLNKNNFDIWLPNNNWQDHFEKNQAFKKDSRYHFINAKKVFNNNLLLNENKFNDYWEMGMQRPDLLVLDLAALFYPLEFKKHKLRWYKEL